MKYSDTVRELAKIHRKVPEISVTVVLNEAADKIDYLADLLEKYKAQISNLRRGTQTDINNAKERNDATLLPYNTLFISLYGSTDGMAVRRIDSNCDDTNDVRFKSKGGTTDFNTVNELAVMTEDEFANHIKGWFE